jgi:hypothetical protein
MPEPPRRPDQDALAGEVDRLLRQLRPGETGALRPPVATASTRAAPLAAEDEDLVPSTFGVWGRVLLGWLLAAGLTQWPYRYCGVALLTYLAGTAILIIAGIWGARGAWRLRLGFAHTLAILMIFAGSILAAHQVLPRYVYGAVAATWRCF